jgi:hypothetical protein
MTNSSRRETIEIRRSQLRLAQLQHARANRRISCASPQLMTSGVIGLLTTGGAKKMQRVTKQTSTKQTSAKANGFA